LSTLVNYLDLAKRARHDSQAASRSAHFRGSPPEPAETGSLILGARRDEKDRRSGQNSSERAQKLTVEEALEEMERPLSGPGKQARLYQADKITRQDAVRWIACAILYRRMDGDARAAARERFEGQKKAWRKGAGSEPAFFVGWQRHVAAVEEALIRFCEGEDKHSVRTRGEDDPS
jgi:hypothetical protein